MKYEMKMPDLATTGSVIRVVRWLKQRGQLVRRGEFLLEVETDKSAMEVESTVTGILSEIRMAAEAEVTGGDVIAVFEVEGTAAPAAAVPPPIKAEPSSESKAETAAPPDAENPPASSPGGMFARNRSTAAKAFVADGTPAAEITLTPARRTAARRLQESKQTVPHFYLQSSANATALLARREAAGEPKPVWDAFFVQAAARVLPRFDQLAYRFEDGRLIAQASTNIGIAADIDGELFVASVDAAAGKSVAEISDQLRRSVAGLRDGNTDLMRITPGAFTISNLGSTGVESFTAIINPPEAAILAIGAIRPVVVAEGGGYTAQPRVTLTLSVDHRVVNGKYAATFLTALIKEIESPSP